MSERAGLNKRLSYHFVLDEPKLRKIVDVMRTSAQKLNTETKLTFHITTENNAFFSTGDIDVLLDYENPKGKEIDTLNIELRSLSGDEDTDALAQLVFAKSHDEKMQLSITGPSRDWCFVLGEELETQAKRTHTYKNRPWLHAGVADILLAFGVVFAVAATLFSVVSRLDVGTDVDVGPVLASSLDKKVEWLVTHHAKRHANIGNPALILSSVFVALAMSIVLSQAKPISALSRMFQRSTFYWGDAKTRHDNHMDLMKNIKWVVVVGFIVSVVGGLATIVFQSKLFP